MRRSADQKKRKKRGGLRLSPFPLFGTSRKGVPARHERRRKERLCGKNKKQYCKAVFSPSVCLRQPPPSSEGGFAAGVTPALQRNLSIFNCQNNKLPAEKSAGSFAFCYIVSGTSIFSITRTFLIAVAVALQRVRRACMSASSSHLTWQEL